MKNFIAISSLIEHNKLTYLCDSKNEKGENISWIFFDCIEIDKTDAKTAGITSFKK